jgi:hypothetical protein
MQRWQHLSVLLPQNCLIVVAVVVDQAAQRTPGGATTAIGVDILEARHSNDE